MIDTFPAILKRVEEKRKDYASYSFRKLQMSALNTFFDLAQEFEGLENLYMVSVAVPRVFFKLKSNLYVVDSKTQAISHVAASHPDPGTGGDELPEHIRVTELSYVHGDIYVVPIHGKRTPSSHILMHDTGDVIGIFEVLEADRLKDTQRFFIKKYVNRIGYNLYNKSLAEQNIQHLKFINNLVADIEHNVIGPNLHYKYYLRKMRKFLNRNKEIEDEVDRLVSEVKSDAPQVYPRISEILEQLVVINRAIFDNQRKIERHHKHSSLFLESLFRRDHFLFGAFILKKRSCYLWRDVVLPQLERYRDRFVQQGMAIDHIFQKHQRAGDIKVKVDQGLMAQVAANLLSNAVKYAEWVRDPSGKRIKQVDCGASLIKDCFGREHDGFRFHVYSSGPPIGEDDAAHLFEEGFRVTSKPVAGAGHGLYFVKNVVEVHGGTVGYKKEALGNEFYLIVPV
jgi:signal transduction histidine kinase